LPAGIRALAPWFNLVSSELPGGSLAVKDGDQIIPVICLGFRQCVMTHDWHSPNHMSFASRYAEAVSR
jgi:hypothetical protein